MQDGARGPHKPGRHALPPRAPPLPRACGQPSGRLELFFRRKKANFRRKIPSNFSPTELTDLRYKRNGEMPENIREIEKKTERFNLRGALAPPGAMEAKGQRGEPLPI
jgi:hypothetical protein